MKYLQFIVKNMTIYRDDADKTVLISGAKNYFGLQFTFDEEFAAIPGIKFVEFYKNRQTIMVDLVDGVCAIPNWVLHDKASFEMRVVSGNTVGTSWTAVGITESGIIPPETPEEELPEGTLFVKTLDGERSVPLLRVSEDGKSVEWSVDGTTWNAAISGVPEVPNDGEEYVRAYGDWRKKSGAETSGGLTGTAAQLSLLDVSETNTQTIVAKINEMVQLLQTRGVATE